MSLSNHLNIPIGNLINRYVVTGDDLWKFEVQLRWLWLHPVFILQFPGCLNISKGLFDPLFIFAGILFILESLFVGVLHVAPLFIGETRVAVASYHVKLILFQLGFMLFRIVSSKALLVLRMHLMNVLRLLSSHYFQLYRI